MADMICRLPVPRKLCHCWFILSFGRWNCSQMLMWVIRVLWNSVRNTGRLMTILYENTHWFSLTITVFLMLRISQSLSKTWNDELCYQRRTYSKCIYFEEYNSLGQMTMYFPKLQLHNLNKVIWVFKHFYANIAS